MSSDELKLTYERKPLPNKVTIFGAVLVLLGLAMMATAYLIDHERAAFNGIISLMFLFSIGLGALFFVALEYLVGADWSVPFRRIAEILAVTVFVIPILSIPLFFNMHDLFHWTHIEDVMKDPILQNKTAYLNEPFFIIRSIATFVLVFIFWWLLAGRSFRQDKLQKDNYRKTTTRYAAMFIPVFAITLTFMAIDWMMTLEPHWFSTIFGVYYFAGTFSVVLAVITLIAISLNENKLMHPLVDRNHYYNFGALMFAFTNFWAYIAFSQFLLIWYANIPEETFWFIQRWEGTWAAVSIGMIIIHFIIPYAILLPQPAKSDPKRLKFMAIWLIFAHFYDLYWLVMPTYDKTGAPLSWIEFYPPILCTGIVILMFMLFAKNKNIIPTGDPKLLKGLHFHL